MKTRNEKIEIYANIEIEKFKKENAGGIEFTGMPEWAVSDAYDQATRIVDRLS